MFCLDGNGTDGMMHTSAVVTDIDGNVVTDPLSDMMTDSISTSIMDLTTDTSMVTPLLPGETDRTGDISGEEDEFLVDTFTTDDTNITISTTETDTNAVNQETGEHSTTHSDRVESTTDSSYTMRVTTLEPHYHQDDTSAGQNMTSCTNNVCRNGGTCLTSIDGFQCHCR